MTYAVLDHHCRRDKRGHVSHRYVRFTANRLQDESADTTLYELLELPRSPVVSELHMAMLQQDYDDGLLERKIRKVICRK